MSEGRFRKPLGWGMRLALILSHFGFSQMHRMKRLSRVVASFFGAAVVVGVSSLKPASAQVYGVHVTDWLPDLRVTLTNFAYDKRVQVAGRCASSGSTRLTVTHFAPDERWMVTDVAPDMRICLSGDIDAWFEMVN